MQVCRTHKDIATALGVWKKEEIPEEPEQMYYARGGGGSRLQHYFAPVGQQALKPLSRIPPKRSPGNGHKHWGHPPEGSASCRIKAATGTPGLKDAAQPADLVGPPGKLPFGHPFYRQKLQQPGKADPVSHRFQ